MNSHRFIMSRLTGLVCVSAIASLACSIAHAQVELIGLRKTGYFEQTSNAAPTLGDATTYFAFDVQLRTTGVGDVGGAILHGALNGDHALAQDGNYWSYESAPFATSAALDAKFAAGPYFLSINGGALGAQALTPGDLNFAYPGSFSYLTGTTYSDLSQWKPSTGAFTLNFASHTAPADAQYSKTYVTFFDLTNNTRFDQMLDGSETSFLLNDPFFQDGHSYEGALNPYDQYSQSDDNVSIMNYVTSFEFTTATGGGDGSPADIPPSAVPEPSTYGLIASALLLAAVGRRRWMKNLSVKA